MAFLVGTQSPQQLIAICNGTPRRRSDKGKGHDIFEMQGLHAQDDRRQRRAQHFRIGKRRPCFEIAFGIQTNAYARPNAAAASGALIGRSLTDGLDTQLLDLRSEEHTSEIQSLMRISYAVFWLKKKNKNKQTT